MSAATETSAVPDEDHPTGTAWRTEPRPQPPALPEHTAPCTAAEQAEHLAVMTEAIAGFAVGPALARHRTHTTEGTS
ncbi:hypothetical protein CF54_04130 [Streptomyces sp. Tu 6176]|uniref:hypothetical protein n=1 Tax=Streptomyces sp. Tu 6176 TaxID=1470557 RepID=UPI000448AA98|nr:hypothetical protein [Streptomyces sp. Tu 6176]EYT84000.1 hypothetical protein CF54_04130 [Streptomyces sp. Tu 6176]